MAKVINHVGQDMKWNFVKNSASESLEITNFMEDNL